MADDRADARRLHAIRVTEQAGDTTAWISAVIDRYTTRRARGATEDELRTDRATVLARADMLRGAARSRLGRLWSGQQLDHAFGVLLRDVLTNTDPDPSEVFALAESCKARMLLDSLAGHWVEPDRELGARLSELEREAMRYGDESLGGLTWDELRLGSELALGSRESLDALEHVYSEAGVGFQGVAPIVPVDEIVDGLSASELLIEFVIPHHPLHPAVGVWAVVIARDGARLIPVLTDPMSDSGFVGRITTDDHAPVDFSRLGEAIVTLRSSVQEDHDDARVGAVLRALHDVLITPLAEHGVTLDGWDRVTVVPHRMLHPVPFAALTDANGRRLVDRASISVAPSASAWSVVRRGQRQLKRHFVALANPTLADMDPLPYAEREVDEVSGRLSRNGFTVDVRARAQASESALNAHAAEAGILYLATHGNRPDGDALDMHGVHLSASDGLDGVITASEIRRLDLSAAWTVVLSVCDGALYRFGPGDEPLGLVPALLVAGASNVVGTLWPIDDTAGRDLMVRMMSRLVELGPAGALRAAEVDYSVQSDASVRDWAAYVVVGVGGPPT
jgi:CHAT domain-containing protein